MTDKIIMNNRPVGGDYFFFQQMRCNGYKLEHYLKFDQNDYWIYKKTRHQKEVSYKEFLDFKYACYTFFKKNKYNNTEINKWIEWFITNLGGMMYLVKPPPPIEMIDKIKIKK